MKLPSIQYQQRRPTAKIDPSMYVALGRAEAQAAHAVGEIGDTVQEVYDRESVAQMQNAYLNYSEKMDSYTQDQNSYVVNDDTGETEGAWINGQQNFDNYEYELRDSVNKGLTSPLARRLFTEKTSAQNVQNKKMNNIQLGRWQKEHEVAGVHTRLNRQVDNKDFNDARSTVVEAMTVGTINEPEAAKQVEAINYEELNHEIAVGVDSIETPEDAISYRKTIEGSTLKQSDKNRNLAAVDDSLIGSFQGKINDIILNAETRNDSKQEGYAAGRAYLDAVMRTDPEKLGGDDQFKEMVVSTTNTILNRYKATVEKQTVENKRTKRMNDLEAGYTIAGPDYNETEYADIFNTKYMNYEVDGKTGYIKDFENPNQQFRAVTDKEFLQNKDGVMDRFVDYSAEGGHMPNTQRDIIRAALTHGDSKQGNEAVTAINSLWRDNPFAVYRNGENDDFGDIAIYSEMMGGGEGTNENALNLWRKTKSMSKDMRQGFVGSRKDNDTFFTDNIDATLDKQFGQKDTAFYNFWTNTTPVMRQKFKVSARMAMDKFLPAYEGDKTQALNAALISLKGSYGTTGVNGDFSIMQNAPDDAVVNGKKNNGEWLRIQLEDDIRQNYGEDIDMAGVYTEPVEKFNANDPAYNVYERTEDGMVRLLGVTKYDYTKSGEYIENKETEAKQTAANKRINDNAKQREQWELDNPVGSRERTRRKNTIRRGGTANPFGRRPEQSPIGKALTRLRKEIKEKEAAGEFAKVPMGAFGTRGKTPEEKELELKNRAKRKLGRRGLR